MHWKEDSYRDIRVVAGCIGRRLLTGISEGRRILTGISEGRHWCSWRVYISEGRHWDSCRVSDERIAGKALGMSG